MPAAEILKPSEAVPGTGIPFLNLTYHVGEALEMASAVRATAVCTSCPPSSR